MAMSQVVQLQAQLHKLTSQLEEMTKEREALNKGELRLCTYLCQADFGSSGGSTHLHWVAYLA